MELNGARSNHFASDKGLLRRLNELQRRLLHDAERHPREPRQAPPKASAVLGTITQVLKQAGQPMRAREIHSAAELLAGEPLRWTSVKAALAAEASGPSPRFTRVRRGLYEVTR